MNGPISGISSAGYSTYMTSTPTNPIPPANPLGGGQQQQLLPGTAVGGAAAGNNSLLQFDPSQPITSPLPNSGTNNLSSTSAVANSTSALLNTSSSIDESLIMPDEDLEEDSKDPDALEAQRYVNDTVVMPRQCVTATLMTVEATVSAGYPSGLESCGCLYLVAP